MNASSTESPWRKSSYSTGAQSQCVEVAVSQGATFVRDTADRAGTVLSVNASAWTRFLDVIR